MPMTKKEDFGTEKDWLADGKVCHCIACVAARKCVSDIKLMEVSNGY